MSETFLPHIIVLLIRLLVFIVSDSNCYPVKPGATLGHYYCSLSLELSSRGNQRRVLETPSPYVVFQQRPQSHQLDPQSAKSDIIHCQHQRAFFRGPLLVLSS